MKPQRSSPHGKLICDEAKCLKALVDLKVALRASPQPWLEVYSAAEASLRRREALRRKREVAAALSELEVHLANCQACKQD